MKLSIVITTRNRPEAVFYNLSSLMQNESDFEVIVSDNGTSRLCKDAFDKATNGDKRFTYVRPDRPLDIYDHFEFALQFAKGDYITFLEDKKIFFAGAIDFVSEICNKYNPEIVSYDICFYTPSNESFDKGSYKSFQVMDGKDEIEEYDETTTRGLSITKNDGKFYITSTAPGIIGNYEQVGGNEFRGVGGGDDIYQRLVIVGVNGDILTAEFYEDYYENSDGQRDEYGLLTFIRQ